MSWEVNAGSRRLAAWSVHLFTASGALLGLLALLAIESGRAKAAFLWILITLVIDGLDGPLARLVGVREVLPRFDGVNLDLIVDYLTYVVVPALFFFRFNLLPPGWRLFGTAAILIASQYHSANLDQKTPDYYFRGFPAWWSVLAFYFYVFRLPVWVNLALVIFFAIATFVPGMLFLHPLRAPGWKKLTIAVLVAWSAANLGILLRLDNPPDWLLWLSLAGLAYLIIRCIARMVQGPLPEPRIERALQCEGDTLADVES